MNIVFDLDGVIYRGDTLIPGSEVALQHAANSGAKLWFATNNSTNTPQDVVSKVRDLAGYEPTLESIVTSAQAAASMLEAHETPVFVLGAAAIDRALLERGLGITEQPDQAAAVVVGMDRELTYPKLAAAVRAVRNGARFIATNVDPTYPVEGGFEPGSGALVAAVSVASERDPEIAGKPHAPMRDLIVSRGVASAWVIGDRVDTDVALANTVASWTSVLVLTGVSARDADLSDADYVVDDMRAAVDLVLATESD